MSHRPRSATGYVTMLVLGLVLGAMSVPVAQAAYDAVNADRVDGKHAVSSTTSPRKRRGKLVATDPRTGRLPDDIIERAPDSARLGGVPAAQTRFLEVPPLTMGVSGAGARVSYDEVNLIRVDEVQDVRMQAWLPPERRPANPLTVDVLAGAYNCAAIFRVPELWSFEAGEAVNQATVQLSEPGATLRLHWRGGDLGPDALVSLLLQRVPAPLGPEMCGAVSLRAVRVNY